MTTQSMMRDLGRRLFSSLKKLKAGDTLHSFTVDGIKGIPELDLHLVKLTHGPTGAKLWHVDRDDPNSVFCVAFRTPPSDSTGVPHILEHTTLCGSVKYPVRDPFFKMLNRSLASYMNAWTASDHTAYPFCTANASDYANLRDVYCDAVFHPKLSRLDFLQEGWRLEPEDPLDPASPLKFKGVVFNEMKGAFSDVESLFAQRLQQNAFPNSIYTNISGGDPLAIPDLTFEQLVQFHRDHYHPSNALFYTYGNYPLTDTLAYLEGKLKLFERSSSVAIQVPRSTGPFRSVQVEAPTDSMNDPGKQGKIAISYQMNDVSVDPQETFHLQILSHLLLDGSAAPLHKALIDSNIGQDYAPGTGYDPSTKIATFSVGLQGVSQDDFSRIQSAIEGVLAECEKMGFPQERIDSTLHLLELGTKHQSSKYGLALSHGIISSWVYGAEPEAGLSINGKIEEFKRRYAQGGLFESLIRKHFLANDSKLVLTMAPSDSYNRGLSDLEDQKLEERIGSLSKGDKKRIIQEAQQLQHLQNAKESLDSLPCLKFDDLTREAKVTEFSVFKHDRQPKVLWRTTPKTNGLHFAKTLLPIKFAGSAEDIKLLPLACEVLTELGAEGKPIEVFVEESKRYTGGLSSSLHMGRQPWSPNAYPELSLLLGTYTLDRNFKRGLELLQEAISKTDWSNLERLRTIVSGNASSMMNSIASKGHGFAMAKAQAALSKRGHLGELTSGLEQIHFISDVLKEGDFEGLSNKLKGIAEKLFKVSPSECSSAVIATSDGGYEALGEFHENLLKGSPSITGSLSLDPMEPAEFVKMPFATSFAAKAYQFDPYNLADSANLAILASILRSQHLHREIREKGGAYGGGATYSSLNGTFNFYSYRDPNPGKSLEVFDGAPAWFLAHGLTEQELLEAKLSVFSSLDAPVSVESEGMHQFFYGVSDVDRQLYRDELFKVSAASLKDTLSRLFGPNAPSKKCIIGPNE